MGTERERGATGIVRVKGEGWGRVMGIGRGSEGGWDRGMGTGEGKEEGFAHETGRVSSLEVWLLW